VRINSDLRIAGDLTAPRVEGTLGLTTAGSPRRDPRASRRLRIRDRRDQVPHERERQSGSEANAERIRGAADGRPRQRAERSVVRASDLQPPAHRSVWAR